LSGLGSLIDLTEVDAGSVFLGGLSHKVSICFCQA
jgi:hypothetical protein